MEELRRACAAVAERARFVRIESHRLAGYAARLPLEPPGEPGAPAEPPDEPGAPAEPPGEPGAPAGRLAAFWLTLDAINFGSGWFPTLRKREGRSGYYTIEAGLSERFDGRGGWSADALAAIEAREIAETLGQDPSHELMELFARSLRDLGRHVRDDHRGRFDAVAAGDRAVAVVARLASWNCFADVSSYDGLRVPFLKRAQIAAADLQRSGAARFGDMDRLTMFADNLVPHVLRLDGVLSFAPGLVARIEREELIEHGSPEEVEIRACAVHAVELIVAARQGTCAADIDQVLWLRGQEPRYKAVPRHRSRCTAY